MALEHDAAYQIAKLSHKAASVSLPLAETVFRPSLSASSALGRSRSNSTGVAATNPANQVSMDLSLLLYDKTTSMAVKQVALDVEVSALNLEEAKQSLMLRVANSYFRLLASIDSREVARVQKIAIQRQMDLANERLEVGLGTRTDLFDAKARFQQAQADEILAENQINNNIAVLKEMIGVDPGEVMPLADDAPLTLPVPNNVEDWIVQAGEHNLSLKIQELNVASAMIELQKKQNTRSPKIGLSASHSWTESGSGRAAPNDFSGTSVALSFSIPIYSGGAIALEAEQAMAKQTLAAQLLEQAERQVSTATITEFLAVSSQMSQAKALLEAIVAGKNALEAKEEGFSAGLTTNLDVLDAQRDLSRSTKDYLQARYNYILSTLNLEKATGQLDEDDIHRVNAWLKPANSTAYLLRVSPRFISEIPQMDVQNLALNER